LADFLARVAVRDADWIAGSAIFAGRLRRVAFMADGSSMTTLFKPAIVK
jgi:hypothetical protein